jgi:hypothetical protein
MRAVRFHREVYRGEAVDEAVKLLERFATFARKEEPDHWVIEVTSSSPAREKKVALELGNHALTLSRK